jgi:hypothetical protein
MASPYFSQMNLPQQDFSVLQNAGKAWGDAYKEVGQAVGKIGSAYFEEKGFEKQTSDFMKTDMGKKYLEGLGVELPEDPKEVTKMVKEMIKSQGGFKEVQNNMRLQLAENRAAEAESRQNYLFEQGKAKEAAALEHSNRMTGSTPNPAFEDHQKKLSNTRSKISDLSERLSNKEISNEEYDKSFYDYGKQLSTLTEQGKSLKEVIPLTQLDPDKFLEAYGEVKNPYLNQLKMSTYQQLLSRRDKMQLEGLDGVEKRLRIKNLQDDEKAAAAASSFLPAQKIVFNDGEAMQQVQTFANENKLQLSNEQMQAMKEQVTVASVKDIKSQKKDYEKTNRLNEADTIIEASNAMFAMLDTVGADGKSVPLTDTISIEKLARMIQPTGLLTEDDIERASGSKGIVDRFRTALQQAKDGTIDDDKRADLRIAGEIFRQEAAKIKIAGTEQGINEMAGGYVSPNDPYYPEFKKQIRERFYSEEYKNLPEELLPENIQSSVQEAQRGDRVVVPVDGKKKTVRVDHVLPNGNRVVTVDGEKKIIRADAPLLKGSSKSEPKPEEKTEERSEEETDDLTPLQKYLGDPLTVDPLAESIFEKALDIKSNPAFKNVLKGDDLLPTGLAKKQLMKFGMDRGMAFLLIAMRDKKVKQDTKPKRFTNKSKRKRN